MRALTFLLAGAISVGAAIPLAPSNAAPLPSPSEMMTAAEQALFSEIVRARMLKEGDDAGTALLVLNDVLAKATEPTKFRGFVQMLRSSLLQMQDRNQEAMAAADEAVRLLPGYSAPLLSAGQAYAYSSRAPQAVDFLIRASEIDPEIVRDTMDDYEIHNLMHRLNVVDDERRIQALADRLLAIGWRGKQLGSRSALATIAIKNRLETNNVAEARALIPEVLVPTTIYRMLASNRYRPIWPDLEKWAGPKLSRQWSSYLTEARSRWVASRSPEALRPYLDALLAAGRFEDVVTDIYPTFGSKLDPDRDYDLMFAVPGVARALAHLGRWNDVKALFAKANSTWVLGKDINALNITANQGYYLRLTGEADEALKLLDRSIAEAERNGETINPDALVAMHAERACTLHELGRSREAAVSLGIASGIKEIHRALDLRLCLNEPDMARKAVLAALADESRRDDVIALMQKPGAEAIPSPHSERLRRGRDALRADPAIIAEVSKHGRILPYAVNEAAEFAFAPAPKADESIPAVPNT